MAGSRWRAAAGWRPTRWSPRWGSAPRRAGSGVALDNGVAVDSGLRASAPGVYAAGDCAAFESRRFGRRLRVEHWDMALHAPEVVAANICGGAEVYDPVPY